MQKFLAFLKRERFEVTAVVLCIIITVTGLCCESETTSILDPTLKVTRAQLNAELDKLLIDVEQRFADLDRQDKLKQLIYDHVMLYSTTGTFNPAALVPLLTTLFGIGAIADNVTKRKELKSLSKEKPPTS